MIRFVDLFAGIGGIRRGVVNALTQYGIDSQCVLSSEIDEKACETYNLNYHEYPCGDIREIEEIIPFDLLLAGFPCQPFSYAGKRQGFGDTRGTLFFEVERILEKYKPKAFLLENVRGLYTHDNGRTFKTIIDHLHALGYGTYDLLLNSSDFGVPQNRIRLYILGIRDAHPKMTLVTNLGATDSHTYRKNQQLDLFGSKNYMVVADILENQVDSKYICSEKFQSQLRNAIGNNLNVLHGWRMMDYRGGQSVHSWDMGMRGECTEAEKNFMNLLIKNRRHPEFGRHQDGKKLSLEQIRTFYHDDDIEEVAGALCNKGYLKNEMGKYSPVCGNMSFEVFKFLDPQSVSITLTSSDCNRLGVIQNNQARHITPRECARLQGFPDDFIVNPNDKFAYKQFGNSVSVPVIEALFHDFLSNNIDLLGWCNHTIRQCNVEIFNSGYISALNKKLHFAKGNAFDYKSLGADGIGAFVKEGFTGTSASYHALMENNPTDVKIQLYTYNNEMDKVLTVDNIDSVISNVLTLLATSGAKHISLPTVDIVGLSKTQKDETMAIAISRWLDNNPTSVDRITLVDLQGFGEAIA